MGKFFNIVNILGPLLEVAKDELGERLLNTVEDFVQETDNKVDDAIVLPAIRGLRIAFGLKEGRQNETV